MFPLADKFFPWQFLKPDESISAYPPPLSWSLALSLTCGIRPWLTGCSTLKAVLESIQLLFSGGQPKR